MNTRRHVLASGVAALTLPILPAQSPHEGHAEEPVQPAPKRVAKFFNKRELPLLSKLVDLIIPRTDTPGAADAGVPYYIDWQAQTNPEFGGSIRAALRWVNKDSAKGFLKLSEAEQIARLHKWELATGTEANRVFRQIKDLTIDGYYGTREGLAVELGWHGNTFLREFKGCEEKV